MAEAFPFQNPSFLSKDLRRRRDVLGPFITFCHSVSRRRGVGFKSYTLICPQIPFTLAIKPHWPHAAAQLNLFVRDEAEDGHDWVQGRG